MPLRQVVPCVALLAFLFVDGASLLGEEWIEVRSPDARVTLRLAVDVGQIQFQVIRDGRVVIGPSALRPQLADVSLWENTRLVASERGSNVSQFDLPWGKTKTVSNRYSYAVANLQSQAQVAWTVELRAYDDGVAWRYVLRPNEAGQPLRLLGEDTEFAIEGAPRVMFNTLEHFTTSHEMEFQFRPLHDVPAKRLMDCPVLLVWPNGQAAAITEARIRSFPGMYVERPTEDSTSLRCRLSPLLEHSDSCVVSTGALQSPWRVVLLGDSAGKLHESNLLLCLNDPPAADFSWVEPGKTTFHWWNGDFEEDYTLPDGDETFVKRHFAYIDFCVRNGIRYHALSGDGRPWYEQTGGDYGNPTVDADVRKPRPEIQLPAILEYARQRDVGMRLWVHWKPLSAHLDEAFSLYESWGIRGLMVDFLDRDDQEMNE
ncbi:MAG: glycoside hydrolase family 97 N-terminal domain-containing protein, partial [Planctomycetales bacterium]|nr:glycoside hydrolase family 97 N-terminal domain-containing protein [Planctomycetales bacterium]